MSDTYVPTGEFVAAHAPYVDQFAAAADDIRHQNAIAETLRLEVATMAVQETALSYLRTQQASTFKTLLEAQGRVPYEEMLDRCLQNEGWRAELAARLGSIARGEFEEALKIRADAERAAELVPAIAETLRAVVEQEVAEVAEQQRSALREERRAAGSVARKLGQMFRTAGILPIPELLSPDERAAIFAEVHPPEEANVDIFVTEPHRLSDRQLAERIRHNYPDQVFRGASEFLALLLAEDPGRAFTFSELGSLTYGDDEPNAISRASSLMIANESGRVKIINAVLAERGLRLERGERYDVDEAGQRKGRARVIFRAVPIQPQQVESAEE